MDVTAPLAVVGALTIAVGAGLVYLPAGLIVLGLLCVVPLAVGFALKVER